MVGVVTVSATEQVAAVMVATGSISAAAEIDGGANVTPVLYPAYMLPLPTPKQHLTIGSAGLAICRARGRDRHTNKPAVKRRDMRRNMPRLCNACDAGNCITG